MKPSIGKKKKKKKVQQKYISNICVSCCDSGKQFASTSKDVNSKQPSSSASRYRERHGCFVSLYSICVKLG